MHHQSSTPPGCDGTRTTPRTETPITATNSIGVEAPDQLTPTRQPAAALPDQFPLGQEHGDEGADHYSIAEGKDTVGPAARRHRAQPASVSSSSTAGRTSPVVPVVPVAFPLPARPPAAPGIAPEPIGAVVAGEVRDELWRHLETSPRADRMLLAVSLTVPSWRRPAELRPIIEAFAARVSPTADTGILAVFDVAPTGREHFYTVFLARSSAKELVEEWCQLTGAVWEANNGKCISGQRYAWCRAENRCLVKNLGRVLQYAFKALPEDCTGWSLGNRVVASGPFAALWGAVCARLGVPAEPNRPNARTVPTRPLKASLRMCQRCGKPVPWWKRAGTQWCSPSCRTLAWRARVALASAGSQPPMATALPIALPEFYLPPLQTIASPTTTAKVLAGPSAKVSLEEQAGMITAGMITALPTTTAEGTLELARSVADCYLAGRSAMGRRGVRAGLRGIAQALGHADEQACPWAALTAEQIAAAVEGCCSRYTDCTAVAYVSALRRVLAIAGRDDLVRVAGEQHRLHAAEWKRRTPEQPERFGERPQHRLHVVEWKRRGAGRRPEDTERPLLELVSKLLDGCASWSGTMTELHHALRLDAWELRPPGAPTTPACLGMAVRRLLPALQRRGVSVATTHRNGRQRVTLAHPVGAAEEGGA